VRVTYDPVGSGLGLERIRNHSVDFGASDAPLTASELQSSDLVQFPVVVGGVVPVINITGIRPGELKMSGQVLAEIYLGKIRRWNDASIAALNPDIKLPSANITVVHRSDPSGSSFLWSDYLSRSSEEWRRDVGTSLTPRWPTGVAGTGNEGVASYVQRTRFAIGYVEYYFARDHRLSDIAVRNRNGVFVHAGYQTFRAAADATAWGSIGSMGQLPTDASGAHSWPITGASFILTERHARNRDTTHALLQFFDWALHQGEPVARRLEYVPIPRSALEQLPALWQSIHDARGPVWP
jgi:phosphate transport system substrate-binding protein